MLQAIIDKFSLSVASAPTPATTVDRIGSVEPSSPSQLPRLVVSVVVDDTRGTGLARLARTGEIPVQQRTIVQVAPGPDGFASDLRTLRIARLPVRKSPSSPSGPFGAADLTLANVSSAQPVPYALVATPVGKAQFSFDERSATIRFGTAQTPGDKLDLMHWTVEWHDDIATTRARGHLFVDLWAGDAVELDGVARKMVTSVYTETAVFRRNGFVRLSLLTLDPITSLVHQPGSGTSFATWRQRVGCSFVFDYETGGAANEGVPIKQIEVEPEGFAHESMTVR